MGLLDYFRGDHVGRAALMQRQSGGDRDEIAALDQTRFNRFMLKHPYHVVGALETTDWNRMHSPNQTKRLDRLAFRAYGDNRLPRPIAGDQPRRAARSGRN